MMLMSWCGEPAEEAGVEAAILHAQRQLAL